MTLIKKFISVLLLAVPVLFSTNSFAFNMPKEFASEGAQSLSRPLTSQQKRTSPDEIKRALLAQYRQWKGTRYHWGGSSHKGIDCSALMQHIFSASLHEHLPRTTFGQIKKGTHVNKSELKAGDLVFFHTKPGMRHVGVYLGNSKFMHASSSKGVTISSLTNHFWERHYETARRLDLLS